jgi:hypothetical protein
MIKANVFLFNKHLDDLGVKTDDKKARFSCLKSEVSNWRETIIDEEEEVSKDHCIIYLKNGDSALIDLPFSVIDAIMSEYMRNNSKK